MTVKEKLEALNKEIQSIQPDTNDQGDARYFDQTLKNKLVQIRNYMASKLSRNAEFNREVKERCLVMLDYEIEKVGKLSVLKDESIKQKNLPIIKNWVSHYTDEFIGLCNEHDRQILDMPESSNGLTPG
jgi:hypothetical protein